MIPVLWIVVVAIAIFAVLVVIGLCCIAADDCVAYYERDCRATVERSNGLSDEQLAIINGRLEQLNDFHKEIYGEGFLKEREE